MLSDDLLNSPGDLVEGLKLVTKSALSKPKSRVPDPVFEKRQVSPAELTRSRASKHTLGGSPASGEHLAHLKPVGFPVGNFKLTPGRRGTFWPRTIDEEWTCDFWVVIGDEWRLVGG